jgi:hypothetical protein
MEGSALKRIYEDFFIRRASFCNLRLITPRPPFITDIIEMGSCLVERNFEFDDSIQRVIRSYS